MQTRIDDLDCSVALPVGAKFIPMVTFVIDPKAVSRVERELSKIGQLKIVPADVAANTKVNAKVKWSELEFLVFFLCNENVQLKYIKKKKNAKDK